MTLSILNSPTLTMTSQEVADLVGKRHDNVKRTVETCAAGGAISLPQFEEVRIQRERREETAKVYILDKRSSLIVVAQLSPEFTARLVDRWQALELEAKQKQASNSPPLTTSALEAIQVGTLLAQVLNLHGTEKTSMISRALQIKAPEYMVLLPAYSTNAPRTVDGKLLGGEGSSKAAFAATGLLKQVGSKLSIHKFNDLAVANGFLEQKARPSTKHVGVSRNYLSVTPKGLEFGYNLSNEHSKGSVQPVWFAEDFQDLLKMLSK